MSVVNKFMNILGIQEDTQNEEYEEEELEEEYVEPRKNKGNNIVSIHSQKNVKVVLYEPRSYEEAQEIADHLRAHRAVVINLQRIRKDQAFRIIDFLSGTVYALSGSISKLGNEIFICTPNNIDIQGSITDIFTDEEIDRMR